jgi:hypothetical protein
MNLLSESDFDSNLYVFANRPGLPTLCESEILNLKESAYCSANVPLSRHCRDNFPINHKYKQVHTLRNKAVCQGTLLEGQSSQQTGSRTDVLILHGIHLKTAVCFDLQSDSARQGMAGTARARKKERGFGGF